MLAAIDVGSNTLRMLIGEVSDGCVLPATYHRQITRLGGCFSADKGLAPESMERALSALASFAAILQKSEIKSVRCVGTAALRRAVNRRAFITRVKAETGLSLEVIPGQEEARLSAAGVLGVIEPLPRASLIVDIGGGSCEFILCQGHQIRFQQSYPLGVVRLCEEADSNAQRNREIERMLEALQADLRNQGEAELLLRCQLIGTAGTVTTLAAMQLEMRAYDWRRINNHILTLAGLQATRAQLLPLTTQQREQLPGLEAGRGDLIIPGLEILLALFRMLGCAQLKVADSGLLEGVLLQLAQEH